MSGKRSKNSKGPRKKSKSGVTSSQYIFEDDNDPSGSGAEPEHVRTWNMRGTNNGRYGGRRESAKVTEARDASPQPAGFDFSAPEPGVSTGDVFVEVPDLLRSRKRKRKQRNDSVRHFQLSQSVTNQNSFRKRWLTGWIMCELNS